MKFLFLPFFALLAGAAIAIQAAMNARLGVLLKSPLLAACVAFCSSLLFTGVVFTALQGEFPTLDAAKRIPFYLWFAGGLLSTFGIASFYWLIPKMGVGPLVSYGLTGQLLVAIIAGHFGWFHLPLTTLTPVKGLGMLSLFVGILLINQG